MGRAMNVREAIQGLQDIRGILTKKERCFSDVLAERAADGRGLTDEEVLTAVRLLRKYDISRREDGGPSDVLALRGSIRLTCRLLTLTAALGLKGEEFQREDA